eukprot:scaffold4255_cov85-Isochrysis_galbana.AAC.2
MDCARARVLLVRGQPAGTNGHDSAGSQPARRERAAAAGHWATHDEAGLLVQPLRPACGSGIRLQDALAAGTAVRVAAAAPFSRRVGGQLQRCGRGCVRGGARRAHRAARCAYG